MSPYRVNPDMQELSEKELEAQKIAEAQREIDTYNKVKRDKIISTRYTLLKKEDVDVKVDEGIISFQEVNIIYGHKNFHEKLLEPRYGLFYPEVIQTIHEENIRRTIPFSSISSIIEHSDIAEPFLFLRAVIVCGDNKHTVGVKTTQLIKKYWADWTKK